MNEDNKNLLNFPCFLEIIVAFNFILTFNSFYVFEFKETQVHMNLYLVFLTCFRYINKQFTWLIWTWFFQQINIASLYLFCFERNICDRSLTYFICLSKFECFPFSAIAQYRNVMKWPFYFIREVFLPLLLRFMPDLWYYIYTYYTEITILS